MKKLVQALKIMLQRVPKNVNLPELRQKILCLDAVDSISHLHVWPLTKEKIVASVHVQVTGLQSWEEANRFKTEVKNLFKDLETEHITVELEAK